MRATNPMHVHLYKVSRSDHLPRLERLIERISAQPLGSRLLQVTNRPIRLEEFSMTADGLWRLAFVKFRSEGPGRASPGRAAESIVLDRGESFSEDTAALFDPQSNALVLQYNHYGPRAQAIEDYFSVSAGMQLEKYSFELQINREAQARLQNKRLFSRLRFKIAPDKISRGWREANISLASAFKRTAQIADGDWVTVEIALDRKNGHTSLGLVNKLGGFLGLANESREAVHSLEITGREDVGEKLDVVDLIRERVQRSFVNLDLDDGRRIPMELRWNCLYDAYSTWRDSGLI